jgi:hypothetical protein
LFASSRNRKKRAFCSNNEMQGDLLILRMLAAVHVHERRCVLRAISGGGVKDEAGVT